MGMPLPALRPSIPAAARIRVGERTAQATQKRFWFDVALETEQAGVYATNDRLMALLAKELGVASSAEEWDEKRKRFRPRRAPIELIDNNVAEWLMIRLSKWRGGGVECASYGLFVEKPAKLLRSKDQQEALFMQKLPTEPTPEDIEQCPEYHVGRATRFEYELEEVKGKTVARRTGCKAVVCDPLMCPDFKANQGCKPEIAFHFLLPWARSQAWGVFKSTSWNTASLLFTTLAKMGEQVGGHYAGMQLLLVTQPKKIRIPGGKRAPYPSVFVEPQGSIRELRDGAEQLLRLQAARDVPALPSPQEYAEDQERAKRWQEEFRPDAPTDVDVTLTAEEVLEQRARAEGMSDEWFQATLAECDGDLDAVEAALEDAVRNGAPKTLFEEGEA